jgi:O-antigen/teichoic acid export membrane protein
MLVDLLFPPLASIVVARAMGPAKLGSFSFVTWLAMTMTALGGNGLSAAARKHMADYAGKQRPDVVRALLRACLRAELVVLAILTLAGLLWARWTMPADERLFASLALIAILPGGAMSMASSVNNAFQEVRPNVVASVCSALVQATGMVVTVVMGWGLVGLAAAHLASRTCDCLVRWKLTTARLPGYLKRLGDDPTPPEAKRKLPPGLGRDLAVFVVESTVLTLLTLVVWNRSEMIFLKRYSAIEQVAYFSVAFGFSVMPGQMVAPFSRAAAVSVYAECGRDAKAGLRVAQVYWRYAVLLVLPACFGLAVLSGPLLRLLYGVRYLDAAPVLMLGASLSMFGPLADPATSLVTASGGQRRLVVVGICAAIATLTLDYFLVRAHAAMGGALANGLGQAISTITIVLIARRYSFTIPFAFLFRVLGAAVGMATLVGTAVHFLPDLGAIAVGIPVGVLAYCVLLRVGRVVDGKDVERLLKAETLLPKLIRPLFRRLLHAMASSNAAAS